MKEIGAFQYFGGELHCEGSLLREVIHATSHLGEVTPAYVYSYSMLEENCAAVRRTFPTAKVRYAVKANNNPEILRIMRRNGFGFDVVSHGELHDVLAIGAPASKIVFAGAAKTTGEIREAVELGVTLVVERPEEMEIISRAANDLDIPTSILLRLRPNVDAHTHKHMTTGTAFSKFGMPLETVQTYLEGWNDCRVKIEGLHFHIGSMIESPEYTAQALDVALPLVDRYGLTELDIGGGFPVCYKENASVPSIQEFGDAVYQRLGERDIGLIIEPGRYLVANTCAMVTTVMSEEYGQSPPEDVFEAYVQAILAIASTQGRSQEYVEALVRELITSGKLPLASSSAQLEDWRIVTCDAGMADLIRAMLYDAYHQIWPLQWSEDNVNILTSIAGPFCESTDFLGRKRLNLPSLKRGDLLAVMHAGAYGRSMASHYNGNKIGAEIMVRECEAIVISPKEQ